SKRCSAALRSPSKGALRLGLVRCPRTGSPRSPGMSLARGEGVPPDISTSRSCTTLVKKEGTMAAPSLIATRRFSPTLRLRLQVLFAKAFESLAETYRLQATEFVRRLRGRMSIEDALDRYFREVGVPHSMEQTVRARALIALAPTARDFPEPETSAVGSWAQLRPDQLVDALR